MIFSSHLCQKIIRSFPGPGTAETIYVTEDGRHWRDCNSVPSSQDTVGELCGVRHGNCICARLDKGGADGSH